MTDFPEKRIEQAESIAADIMEEQRERYEGAFDMDETQWGYSIEEHHHGPAFVLYDTRDDGLDRPGVGGQFLRSFIEDGFIPVSVKGQATEDEGTRVFLIHVNDFGDDTDLPFSMDNDEDVSGDGFEPDRETAVAGEASNQNILEDANDTVGVRAEEYGPPTENFRCIADMWSAYLGVEVTPYDYSQMMILAKIGRTKTGSPDRDTHQDEAGYSLTTDLVNQDGSSPGPYFGGDNA